MIKKIVLSVILASSGLSAVSAEDTPAPLGIVAPQNLPAGTEAAPVQVAKAVLTIGYLHLADDARYDDKLMPKQFLGAPFGRPYPAAEVALKEIKFHGEAAGVSFALEQISGKDSADLIKQVDDSQAKGIKFFVVDLPAKTLVEVAQAFKGKDLLFFNISAKDDALRQAQCQANIFHTIPNVAMQADGLVQYLIAHKWRNALILQGPLPEDQLLVEAFNRAAKRYGLKISDTRPFVLGSDPREREKNNIALLTGGDYDVVYIADTEGEFSRNANYQTLLPRPVVGSEGLNALAWNWAWERHGAPQVEKRFEKQANRHMSDVDWAAWMTVRSLGAAVQQTQSSDFTKIRDYLLAPTTNLDGAKGNPSSFRPWDHQLRQPLLLSTHNWVIDRAPLQGFLHQINNLDTLGFDQPDSQCKF
ncbi:ABC transporter substrate-binding protein [uncultured Thiothrix sp.]|uniref:ABC transporter substrate-binding protein n=1 Tax=uncultured Thiothrix sp. TaxID=223185 RepID=UPI00262A7145|nr:ABC transporter substrate-binding protein [uncultured Thiothrix sp.]